MAIDIIIVREDLITVMPESDNLESIEINKAYYRFRDLAKEMNLILLYSIDEAGITIINQPQQEILREEIQTIRKNPHSDQKILDIIQKALDYVGFYSHLYIKFVGD
ncbi:MAG TPA: hypothetical protein VFF04_06970 [Candidatus Babeliales bacterium]|nr:hypothetical protein [Candidatus Babeliales bacterium]